MNILDKFADWLLSLGNEKVGLTYVGRNVVTKYEPLYREQATRGISAYPDWYKPERHGKKVVYALMPDGTRVYVLGQYNERSPGGPGEPVYDDELLYLKWGSVEGATGYVVEWDWMRENWDACMKASFIPIPVLVNRNLTMAPLDSGRD